MRQDRNSFVMSIKGPPDNVFSTLPGVNWKPFEGFGFQRSNTWQALGAAKEAGQQGDHQERQEDEE